MKFKANSILENIVASVIILVLFIIASNSLNQVFKASIESRDLKFDNQVKEMEYLLINGKKEAPQLIEFNNKTAQFTEKQNDLTVEIKKNSLTKKTICCLEKE
ncbi:hypothetical protein [Nonlabens ulvanivorans]|uniref:hypothetical protein n=1 Tax=Nonlabens ulvanivorans TaxID=906888 RepID=UPI0037C6406C